MFGMCHNHPEKKAVNTCHNCGNNFCGECLTEGVEYYYCTKPECRAVLDSELIPEQIVCANCSKTIMLSFEDRVQKKVHCPHCEALFNFTATEDKILEPDEYVELISSLNQGDVALVKSMLDDAQLSYFVTGENFLSVDPLIQPAKFFVLKNQYIEAVELLKDFKLHIFGASVDNEEENAD